MERGKIKFYDSNKGYGFIYPEGGGKDVFLHKSELERSGYQDLNTGDNICYELKTDKKDKEQAINIKVI